MAEKMDYSQGIYDAKQLGTCLLYTSVRADHRMYGYRDRSNHIHCS